MPAGAASGGASGGGGGSGGKSGGGAGGARYRETKTKTMSKGAIRRKEGLANKPPSGREQKMLDKKAAAKERKAQREGEEYLEAKASWLAEKAKNKAKKFAGGDSK